MRGPWKPCSLADAMGAMGGFCLAVAAELHQKGMTFSRSLWLVGGDWNMTFIFPYIGKFIIPIDYFSEG